MEGFTCRSHRGPWGLSCRRLRPGETAVTPRPHARLHLQEAPQPTQALVHSFPPQTGVLCPRRAWARGTPRAQGEWDRAPASGSGILSPRRSRCAHMLTHIHVHPLTHMFMCVPTHTCTRWCIRPHVCTLAHIHMYALTHTPTCVHTHTHTHAWLAHSLVCTLTHIHLHALTHAYVCARSHMHMH